MSFSFGDWFRDHYKKIIVTALVIPPLLVSFISTIHVVSFFLLTNKPWLAVVLAIAFEVGALSALAALAVMTKISRTSLWVIFIMVTVMQCMGNTYYAYKFISEHMTTNGSSVLYWLELFGAEGGDIVSAKRILAIVSGAILPIISLSFTHLLVGYISHTPRGEEEYEEYPDDANELTAEQVETVLERESKYLKEKKDGTTIVTGVVKEVDEDGDEIVYPSETLKKAVADYNERMARGEHAEIKHPSNEAGVEHVERSHPDKYNLPPAPSDAKYELREFKYVGEGINPIHKEPTPVDESKIVPAQPFMPPSREFSGWVAPSVEETGGYPATLAPSPEPPVVYGPSEHNPPFQYPDATYLGDVKLIPADQILPTQQPENLDQNFSQNFQKSSEPVIWTDEHGVETEVNVIGHNPDGTIQVQYTDPKDGQTYEWPVNDLELSVKPAEDEFKKKLSSWAKTPFKAKRPRS